MPEKCTSNVFDTWTARTARNFGSARVWEREPEGGERRGASARYARSEAMASTARLGLAFYVALCATVALASAARADTVVERIKAADRAIIAELAAKDPDAAA